MSDTAWNERRVRDKTLLIVEGNHEKNKLLRRILASFPEIQIDEDNILIYETNIYILLCKIKEEYGEDWYEQDIDIPYLYGKLKGIVPRETKRNYTNILLIFDYERHDPNFSEVDIERMQGYFLDAADMGRLYINYPMVESYMDLGAMVDDSYENRSVTATMTRGAEYKNEIKSSFIYELIHFPLKAQDILVKKYFIEDTVALEYVDHILNADSTKKVSDITAAYLEKRMGEKDFPTFKNQVLHVVSRFNYIQQGISYNVYMRSVFSQIVIHNIKKANKIQNGKYEISEDIRSCFDGIDLEDILHKQNIMSAPTGKAHISVLNTSVFLIPEYNTELVII